MKKNVLITGVMGGIGKACAFEFLKNNWHVIGIDQKKSPAKWHAIDFIRWDLSKPEKIPSLRKILGDQYKEIHCIVNNAAVQIARPFHKITLKDWDQTQNVNIKSPFFLVQSMFSLLEKVKGSVVNVSSVHAFATSTGMSAYASSKGALIALTRSLAIELAPYDIRCNAVIPGAVNTPMLMAGLERGHIKGKNVNAIIKQFCKKHPLSRIGEPDEIAKAIYFLASNEQSSFMTGQTLILDGGALAQLSTE